MSQVTFDPRTMSPEELQAQLEKALQIQKEFSDKKEKINESVEGLLALTDDTEIEIAVNELLPFITKNIDKADSKLRDRLAVVVERDEEETDKPAKKRGANKLKFQLLHLENFKAEAPNLYQYLVDNENAKPLEENPEKLVVRRKAYSKAVKVEAAKDSDKSLSDLLDHYAESQAQFEPDSEAVQSPEKQPLSAFDNL